MDREEKVHKAIRKKGFHEKVQASFVMYVFRPETAVGFAVILIGVAVFTASLRATCLAAAGFCVALAAAYVLWFALTYFLAYVWVRIVRWMKKTGP